MMKQINGKEIAQRIRLKVKDRVSNLKSTPGLAVILVGDDPASHLYVSLKQKACEEAGINFEKFIYDSEASTEELIAKVSELNEREDIHGILVQLPLPDQDQNKVIAAIEPNKDVDGFHQENLLRLEAGKPCISSALSLGIMKLIDAPEIEVRNKLAVIVGSEFFSRPLKTLLTERGISMKRVSSDSENLAEKTKEADILISVVGKPGLITPTHVKDGAIVIDVGTTRVQQKIAGDVDPEVQNQKTGWITPVPGGVGPMTVAMLLVNVLKAYQLSNS